MIDPTGRQGPRGRRGLPCPECGALRAPDNTPSCACAQRASEVLRDTRTAEAAAAEDFDPLRIRPYVELDDSGPAGAGPGTPPVFSAPSTPSAPSAFSAADVTMPLRAVSPGDRAVDATAPLPVPGAPPTSAPSVGDLNLFETVAVGPAGPQDGEPRGPRRRRALLVATAAAVVGVVAAAGFATGLFSYEKPTRDGAAPEDVRAAVPDTSPPAVSASPSASRSASLSASEAPPSPSESESPSPSASRTSASPSPSPSAETSRPAPTAHASGSLAPGNGAAGNQEAPADTVVLRRGDKGPEVTELQLRLGQLFLYDGEADGTFSGEVEDALRNYQWSRGTTGDGLGVYGPATRSRLETETKEP